MQTHFITDKNNRFKEVGEIIFKLAMRCLTFRSKCLNARVLFVRSNTAFIPHPKM